MRQVDLDLDEFNLLLKQLGLDPSFEKDVSMVPHSWQKSFTDGIISEQLYEGVVSALGLN